MGDDGVAEPFLSLFDAFLDTYLGRSGDKELLEVLPPFFAFRALVIAHPRWYPNLAEATRAALLCLARAMAAPTVFDPARVPSLLETPS